MNIQQLIAYPQGTTEPITYPSGEVVLDLFKDEPIPLVLNVDDFTNVAEVDASYSKSFEMPGTKNNNLFFNHIYDITSDSNFNPHVKTKIIVKEGSINTFEGYMQLNEIIIKEGVITYDITLYSETVNLKDILSERVFRDLDFTELEHIYNITQIRDSWVNNLTYNNAGTSGFRDGGTIKYPFIRWNDGISLFSTGNYFVSNLYGAYNVFKPCINALYLFKRIMSSAGFSFTSSFLESDRFSKLYVDLKSTEERDELYVDFGVREASTSEVYNSTFNTLNLTAYNNWAGATGAQLALYDLSTDKFTSNLDNLNVFYKVEIFFSNTGSNPAVVDVILEFNKGGVITTTTLASGINVPVNVVGVAPSMCYIPNISLGLLDNNDFVEIKIKSVGESINVWEVIPDVSDAPPGSAGKTRITTAYTYDTMDINMLLNSYRGDNNQWEFIKSFITMFKLVVLQDDNNLNNLIIEPYKTWVDTGNLINLTHKVDIEEIKYIPIDGLDKTIIIQHKPDDKDRIISIYDFNNIKWRYVNNSDIEIFDGVENTIEVEGLSSSFYRNILNAGIYAPEVINEDKENFDNSLRVFYDKGVTTISGGVTYRIGSSGTLYTDYLKFTPFNDFNESYDFNSVQYQGGSAAILDSLYNVYWAKYIDELYHKDTRIAKIEAYLTADDISKIKFNDIILIKNKKFRIHKIEYRAGAMSKLELITIKDL
tara:strand:+ start:5296 stop:7422 length:2127 start_codon:yes stop_codon:yes gene_type:complete